MLVVIIDVGTNHGILLILELQSLDVGEMILILTNQAVFVTLSVVTIPPLAQGIFILTLNQADVIGDRSDAVTQNAWFHCVLYSAISGEISILIQTGAESWGRFAVPRICRWESTQLTGKVKTNPPPEGVAEKQLANDFASFFYNKADSIRKQLDDSPLFVPPKLNIPLFTSFGQVDINTVNKDLIKTHKNAKPTTCDLDPIPSS